MPLVDRWLGQVPQFRALGRYPCVRLPTYRELLLLLLLLLLLHTDIHIYAGTTRTGVHARRLVGLGVCGAL